jgi:hypothetical protein
MCNDLQLHHRVFHGREEDEAAQDRDNARSQYTANARETETINKNNAVRMRPGRNEILKSGCEVKKVTTG